MKKTFPIIALLALFFVFTSCESKEVKMNRKTYMEFLKSMSDAPEFLVINKEVVNDDSPLQIYFIVDFETKYIGRTLKDKVKIEFIGEDMNKINGMYPSKYKANYLIDIIND